MFQVDLEASVSRILNRNVYEIQSKNIHQKNHRKNIQSVNSKNNKRPNICVTEKYLKNKKEIIRNKKVVPGNRSYAETASYGKKFLLLETAM